MAPRLPHFLPMRPFLLLGSVSAAIGVAAGAFGAHALRARVEPRFLEVWETAARYQMYHAFALIAVALLMRERANGHVALRSAGWCFVAGTLLFSGSLYAMALSGVTALGAITPLGGACFLAGWGTVAWSVRRG